MPAVRIRFALLRQKSYAKQYTGILNVLPNNILFLISEILQAIRDYFGRSKRTSITIDDDGDGRKAIRIQFIDNSNNIMLAILGVAYICKLIGPSTRILAILVKKPDILLSQI